MSSILLRLNDCFMGIGRAYIYIIYSNTHKALYIGQTNDRHGVIGRFAAHISTYGTLRTRLFDAGIDLNSVGDLNVFAYSLPNDARFIGIDRTHREGVEYLVQSRLYRARGKTIPAMRIISNVMPSSATTLAHIQNTAENVVMDFIKLYNPISSSPTTQKAKKKSNRPDESSQIKLNI
ncbi:GIY-YIG nuclease family protein [Herpetosiphon giganteus]|uniref:GIY-YIG nuclease family protein n=1 Tax=Herpetosiphon giganteus TaxID=2029754 RepID=UPI00195B5742|nr:GIY-YIG nuclease family protein [Herpetosiphon giganteus]MBM7842186.1 hypothetical protein [Herpetosiphon giganteus]